MAERKAKAEWKGTLQEGEGHLSLGSGLFEGKYSFGTRMGEEPGTNPEELVGAALAACYAMALNLALEKEGKPAQSVKADTVVHFGKDESGFGISAIDLTTRVAADGISDEEFKRIAESVKQTCPISKALAAVDIRLDAHLEKGASA